MKRTKVPTFFFFLLFFFVIIYFFLSFLVGLRNFFFHRLIKYFFLFKKTPDVLRNMQKKMWLAKLLKRNKMFLFARKKITFDFSDLPDVVSYSSSCSRHDHGFSGFRFTYFQKTEISRVSVKEKLKKNFIA